MTASSDLQKKRSAHPTDVWIGKRVRTVREARGMSRERLSELVGVAWQQLQKYESGDNRVAGGRLADIAKALKCDVSEFFPPDDTVRVPERDLTRYADNYESLRILRAFGQIADEEVRTALVTLVEFIAKKS
jgi:transcriptional regulator with XRE-family HTH domain